MSGFQSANPLWDFTLPTDALTTLPDDDFLAILQSQIASTNTIQDPAAFFTPQQSNQDIPLSANPKTLTRLPDPATNPSPLTDSSPSPPSGQDGAPPESASNRRASVHGRRGTQDDALKRKASRDEEDEDDEGAPPTNKSHTAQGKSTKRKGGASGSADDVRLLKRKEQNRAAQRAFRERKEKHVKDLEDQLAASEAKNSSTQSENENLKEMLRRLQAENTLLKQAAFTFSVPRASDTKNSNQTVESTGAGVASTSSQSEAQQYIAKVSRKETSGSVTSSQPSPSSLFDDTFGDLYSAPSSVPTDSPKIMADKSPSSSNAPYSTGFDWISSPSPAPSTAASANTFMQSPFTIISSNPTYMSYRDPPQATNDISVFNSTSNQVYPMDQSSQLFSFFPQQQPAVQPNFLSPDIAMKDYSTNADPGNFTFSPLSTSRELSALDELFGGQASAASAFSSYPIGTSPVAHASPSKATPPESTECPSAGNCSKDEIAGLIAAKGQSTFVTSDASTRAMFEARMVLDGVTLPPTEAKDTNIDACAVIESLKNRPEFKDCDINSLCSEFATKARCDGVRAVIPQDEMQGLMDRLAAKTNN